MSIIAQAKVKVSWPQAQQVPVGGSFNVYETSDYNTPLNPSAIEAWPDGVGKIGYGRGLYGRGPYGRGQGGIGYGRGPYGRGLYGRCAYLLHFVTAPLTDGSHTLAVVGVDVAGNKITPATATATVAVAGIPGQPGTPTAEIDGSDIVISWTASEHDQSS